MDGEAQLCFPLLPAIWPFHVRRPAEIRRMLARIEHGDEEKGNYMDEEEGADKVVNEDKMKIKLGEQVCHGQSLDWS